MSEDPKEIKKDIINTKVVAVAAFLVILALVCSVNRPDLVPGGPVGVILGSFFLVFIGIAYATIMGMDEKKKD